MAILGNYNNLPILRETDPGLFLDGGTHGEILLPRRYMASERMPGEYIKVFVYRDSEDRLVATTETPKARVGQFASLEVKTADVRLGAFLDWGLAKDLLLPRREQSHPIRAGDHVVVRVVLDHKSDRIIATTRLNPFLSQVAPAYKKNAEVRLLIAQKTELGFKALVEQAHWGMLYHSELHTPLTLGSAVTGYIQKIREDGKIDLTLNRPGFERIAPLSDQILERLEAAGGLLPFTDHSTPEEIQDEFGVSKKAFKQAIGGLLKKKRITLDQSGFRLVPK